MTEITDFDSYLAAARGQPEPQRLLFVFVKTVLPEDHDEAEAARYREGRGGGLLPVMYVDKGPDEVAGFDALAQESRQMGEDWHIVLTAALAGRHGEAPSEERVQETFDSIIRTIHAGGDLSGLLAFDRDGEPLVFTAGAPAG